MIMCLPRYTREGKALSYTPETWIELNKAANECFNQVVELILEEDNV